MNIHGIPTYAIVGYVCDGAAFCPYCAPSQDVPIFAGDEWDYAPTCDECGGSLDVSVIYPAPNPELGTFCDTDSTAARNEPDEDY